MRNAPILHRLLSQARVAGIVLDQQDLRSPEPIGVERLGGDHRRRARRIAARGATRTCRRS